MHVVGVILFVAKVQLEALAADASRCYFSCMSNAALSPVDEAPIERSILAAISRAPESALRVIDAVVRELGVTPEQVQHVAGRLGREARMRVHGHVAAGTAFEMWSAPMQQVRAADQQAVEGSIIDAIERIAREAALSREVVAQIVGRVAARMIARGA